MLSVTNSGSNIRLTSGDQVKITASATPTIAPSEKPPRISTAVTAILETQAYLAEESVASAASGEGRMNVGTWKASTSSCHTTITERCTIKMTASDRADPPPSADIRAPIDRLFVARTTQPIASFRDFQPAG